MVLLRFQATAFLFAVALALLSLLCIPAQGADLPILTAPTLYTAEYNQDTDVCRATLYLGLEHWFMLREKTLLPNGKISEWETTGKWSQSEDGAFLHLSNAKGLYRAVNIGGAGNLYLGTQVATGKQVTLILRVKESEPPEFTILGTLRVADENIFLNDSNSGIECQIIQGSAIKAFLQNHNEKNKASVPVRAKVAFVAQGSPCSLHISDIQSIPVEKKPYQVSR